MVQKPRKNRNAASGEAQRGPGDLPDTPAHDAAAVRYDLRILRSLRRIMRAVDIYSRKLKQLHAITAPQLICLLAVRDMGPVTSTVIASEMHVSTSTLVGILDRLEAKGLVSRRRATEDRRRVYIVATDKGMELSDKAPSPLQDRLVEGLADLGDGELGVIASSLDKVVELMEAEDISAAPLLDAAPQEKPGT